MSFTNTIKYKTDLNQTVKMVLDDPADRVNKEVIALAVNLASNVRNAGNYYFVIFFHLNSFFKLISN